MEETSKSRTKLAKLLVSSYETIQKLLMGKQSYQDKLWGAMNDIIISLANIKR